MKTLNFTLPLKDKNDPVLLYSVCSEWGKLGGSGSIISTAEDMAKWLQFQLDMGQTPSGDQIIPYQLMKDTHTRQNNLPDSDSVSDWIRPKAPVTYTLLEYGLGWRTGYYRGKQYL